MALQDWIAKKGEQATEIVDPIFVAPNSIEELLFYHPTAPADGVCNVKLALSDDEKYIVFSDVSGNWNPKWLKLLEGVQFIEVEEDGKNILQDSRTQPVKFGVSEWQVVNWRVVETRNGSGQKIFQELLDWENSKGETSFSSYSWIPYTPVA